MSYLAEQNVIGSLFTDSKSINEIYGELRADMFTSEILGRIYYEFTRGFDRGYEITIPYIEQTLRSDNFPSDLILSEIKDCITSTVTSATIRQNAEVVINDYKAQRLNKFLSGIRVNPSDIKSQISTIFDELQVIEGNKNERSKTLAEIGSKYKESYFKEKDEKEKLNLGFDKLDSMMYLEGGDMVVIGARPAVGKSALVTQITSNLGKRGKRIGFYNLEMNEKQMYERFVVNESGIGLTRLKRAIRFLGDEEEKFNKANETIAKSENIIITSGAAKTVREIRAESLHMNYDLIIIDYLQLIKPETNYRGNRASEVGEISRNLKSLAMELDIPIIALSQMNRASEGRDTKEPNMAELREAGNIEQDASVIILMWNLDENDKSKKGCKIDKNRQGITGKIVMKFNGDLMKFEETDEDIKTASEFKTLEEENPFIV